MQSNNTINGVRPKILVQLQALLDDAAQKTLNSDDKLLILSDLHMGDGSRNDDFKHNGPLLVESLRDYYLPKGYFLILNGDIEELLRFRREKIVENWQQLYDIFDQFRAKKRLFWLRGNHEVRPDKAEDPYYNDQFDGESLCLNWKKRKLLIFHGHQAGTANNGSQNAWIGWGLRVFANALGIGNYEVAQDSVKKLKIEKAVYEFARHNNLLSIIGHTHRPLFESISKRESLGFQIERLCRLYSKASDDRRKRIRDSIQVLRHDFLKITGKHKPAIADSIYGEVLTPCLFNSGCGIGKRGITMLEFKKEKLYLVFWSDTKRVGRHLDFNEYKEPTLVGEQSWRFILRRESLDYILSRIEALRPEQEHP